MSETLLNACWQSIGNFGDKSCPELKQHIRCLNCEVYHSAAARLLNRPTPEGYLESWTERIAQPREEKLAGTRSVVVFRIGAEWLALPTEVLLEVGELKPIHTLPHRQDALVRGLTTFRGELIICVSLAHLLGFDAASAPVQDERQKGRSTYDRFLVIGQNSERAVFSVNEVHAGVRYHPDNLKPIPATVAQSASPFTIGLLSWENRSIGVLDDSLLFYALNRQLA